MIPEILKKPMVLALKKMDLYSSCLLRKGGALQEDGWFRSFREESSVDAAGEPIPWLTYPAIAFIALRTKPEMSVLEYGCGSSTFWWARRVSKVVSCEHDETWYRQVSQKTPSNVDLKHIPLEYGGAYCHEVKKYSGAFDIIIIDGRDRINCAKNALSALKPGGVIIWDNSDRDEYREGYQFLFDNGFRKIEFVGMIPIVNCKSETGIFYRKENCLGI